MSAKGRRGTPTDLPHVLLGLVLLLVPLVTSRFAGDAALTLNMFQLLKMVALVVLVFGALCAWSWQAARNSGKVRWHRAVWLLLALMVWYVVSTATSVDWRTSVGGSERFEGLAQMFTYLALVWLTLQVTNSPARIRSLLSAAVIGGAAVGAYALMQAFGLDPIEWGMSADSAGRIFSTYGNPDLMAGYLVFPFICAAGLAFDAAGSGRRRALFATAATAMGIALVLARVRGAWVAAAAGLLILVVAIVFVRRRIRGYEWGTAIAAVALVALMVAAMSAGPAVLNKVTDAGGRGGFSGRTTIWRVALDAVRARPMTGSGPDTMEWAFYRYRDDEAALEIGHDNIADAAHSHPLQLAATIGIPGALLAVALAVWGLVSGAASAFGGQSPRDARFVLAVTLAACAATSVYLLGGIAVPGIMAFFWFGLAACFSPGARTRAVAALGGWSLRAAVVTITLAAVVCATTAFRADQLASRGVLDADHVAGSALLERASSLNPLRVAYDVRIGQVAHQAMVDLVAGGETPSAQVKLQAAEAALRRHIEDVPWDPAGYSELAYLYNDASDLGIAKNRNKAEWAAGEGLERIPQNVDLLKQMAVTLYNLGRPEEAEPFIERAIEFDEEDVDLMIMMAQILGAEGRDSEARAWYEKALDAEPGNAVAEEALAGMAGD